MRANTIGLFIVLALMVLLIAYGMRSAEEAQAECRGRGGVYHCSSYVRSTCDCYTPDGRILLPGMRTETSR